MESEISTRMCEYQRNQNDRWKTTSYTTKQDGMLKELGNKIPQKEDSNRKKNCKGNEAE